MLNKEKIQNLSDSEKLSWLRLARTENVGPITFYKLVEKYGSADAALDALPELAKRGGRKKPLKASVLSYVEREYEALQKMGGDIVTAMCESYPIALTAIDDAPPVLSYIGDIKLANKNCIGIVGARNASLNGRKFAEKLAADLVNLDQTVVSGLARGIDAAAHKGGIASTVAVVAGGIDLIYPEENTTLYKEICERGVVIAESALGAPHKAQLFPKRNRIVSGLSRACVVVEATLRSGSLITARMAGEQGRDVMAVPGHPLDPRAQGPNHLIREGATLIRSADDILEIIRNFSGNALREPLPRPANFDVSSAFSEDEEPENILENARDVILENLSFTPVSVDELLRSCHLTIPVLQTVLLELELAGRIKREAGGRVALLNTEP